MDAEQGNGLGTLDDWLHCAKEWPKMSHEQRQMYRNQGSPNCVRPGPLTINPFLNYLRTVRIENCGKTPQELVSLGAREWRYLPEYRKRRYHREACYVQYIERNKKK